MNIQDSRQVTALAVIARQRASLLGLEGGSSIKLDGWAARTHKVLSEFVLATELSHFIGLHRGTIASIHYNFLGQLDELKTGLEEIPAYYLKPVQSDPESPAASLNQETTSAKVGLSSCVFIVHGHDGLAKVELARTLEKLGLAAIVLHEQPNEGKTIIEKFERDANKVSYAVVLLTPDDVGYAAGKPNEAKARARQNVVMELGFFAGALGRSKVCVLYKGEIEIPSDYMGVVYMKMDDAGAWRLDLAKELKTAGLKVDLNLL